MTLKLDRWIVAISFLILPFMFLVPGLIWKSQLMWFVVCPVFIVALNIRNVWVKSFLLYVSLWQIVVFFAMFHRAGAGAGHGLTILMSLMAASIVYKFVSDGDLGDSKWAGVIRAAVLIQIAVAIPQPWGYSPVTEVLGLFTKVVSKLPDHLVGSLGNRNYLAAFIAMSIPFFIGWRTIKIGKITINPALIVIYAFLLACFSPGTLAAIIGMGFYLTHKYPLKKRLFLLSFAFKAAVAYAAFYVLSTNYHLDEFQALPAQLQQFWQTGTVTVNPFQGDLGRFQMWLVALSKLIKGVHFMVLGFGPAAFWGREYPLHSQFMSVWYQFGLIGLGLMIGYLVTAYRALEKRGEIILQTSLVICGLDMVANFPGEIATTGMLMAIIAGLIERKRLNG